MLRKALLQIGFLAFAWLPLQASAGDAAKQTAIGIGGEFNRFSLDGFATRSGTSFLNLNLSLLQRVHPDVWLGLTSFLSHDPNPAINRNYDQNVGLLLHWFPWSLSTDSAVSFEGMQLSESETFRHFASTNVVFGRVLLRTVNDFDASSDYVGLGLGMGSQYVISPGFAISSSLRYQKNIGTSAIAYGGQTMGVTLGAVLGF
ncbi:hypothetical protein EBR21_08320 [bacterium]|nr:hypothetical protein [bacterium]